jgi:hypothetical protein
MAFSVAHGETRDDVLHFSVQGKVFLSILMALMCLYLSKRGENVLEYVNVKCHYVHFSQLVGRFVT